MEASEDSPSAGEKLFSFLRGKSTSEESAEETMGMGESASRSSFSWRDSSGDRSFLDTYLPWRDVAPSAPQHVDLRVGVEQVVVREEAAVAIGGAADAAAVTADPTVMEKIFRGLLPNKAGSDCVGPLDVHIRAVTGEEMCLKITPGPSSEVSNKIRTQLQQMTSVKSRVSLTLDRVVQHVHLKPSEVGGKATEEKEAAVAQIVLEAQDVPLSNENEQQQPPPPPTPSQQQQAVSLLSRIPVAVTSCRRMTSLTVEGQHLVSIDDLMGAELLEELRIINCDLRELPAQLLQKLPRLRVLDVRQNLLTSVVMGGSHERMATVCMAQNYIAAVPGVLCRMQSLTELDLSFNRLSSLPSDLRNLTALTRLNVEGNTLVTPTVALIRGVLGSIDVVTRFPRLVHLNLSKNKITELPHYIDYLTSLTELVVADNRLSRVPMQLVAVPHLSTLDLSGNALGPVAPKELVLLKSLTVLRLSRAKIASFPQEISSLAHLKELDISHNSIRKIEPADCAGLLSLTSLNASHNRMDGCEFLSQLSSIVRLNLSKNALRALPEDVAVCESLRFVDLSKNRLVQLPDCMAQLNNLEEIDLSSNALELLGSYWNAASFPRLRVLRLEGSPRAATSLHFSFSTLSSLATLSLLGIVVDTSNLTIQNPSRFDLQLVIRAAMNVRHPLLLAAFFGLACRPEYHEGVLSNGGVELMLSLCELGLNSNRPGVLHETWPPKDIFQADTTRYFALRMLTSFTHKMDAMEARWTIYLHGAPAVLMDVINRHPDVRYKLLCIRLLGNLALHPTVKSQIFHNKNEVVAYLEGVARTSHSDSIKRFCNRTFAIFGICQHFQTSLMHASLGRHVGVRILSLDGGGTRALTQVEMLISLRNRTEKPISEMFDLIVGVSAGGLMALSLLVEKTLEEMADMYLTRGYLCFSPEDEVANPPTDRHSSSWNKTIRPMINLATKGSMYRVKTYERELKRYYGNVTMISTAENERNPKVAVVSTLTSKKPALPYLCRNYDYPPNSISRYGGDVTWRLWEVARATSAAPSFFDAFEKDGQQLMDGGLVANNPTAIAYHEYLKIWGREVPIALIVSVGTGVPSSVEMPKERGLMETLEQLVDAAVSQERVHEMMSDVLPPGTPYFRLQPSGPQFACRLDEIRRAELVKLQVAARTWIASNDETFEKISALVSDKSGAAGGPLASQPVVWQDEAESADDISFMADVSDDDDSDFSRRWRWRSLCMWHNDMRAAPPPSVSDPMDEGQDDEEELAAAIRASLRDPDEEQMELALQQSSEMAKEEAARAEQERKFAAGLAAVAEWQRRERLEAPERMRQRLADVEIEKQVRQQTLLEQERANRAKKLALQEKRQQAHRARMESQVAVQEKKKLENRAKNEQLMRQAEEERKKEELREKERQEQKKREQARPAGYDVEDVIEIVPLKVYSLVILLSDDELLVRVMFDCLVAIEFPPLSPQDESFLVITGRSQRSVGRAKDMLLSRLRREGDPIAAPLFIPAPAPPPPVVAPLSPPPQRPPARRIASYNSETTVFVDSSNIVIGAKEAKMDVVAFCKLIEQDRGRIAGRFSVGSYVKGYPNLEAQWKSCGYVTRGFQSRGAEELHDDALQNMISGLIFQSLQMKKSGKGKTIVLCTGDGNRAGREFGGQDFPMLVQVAFKNGFEVEVWAWRAGCSNRFTHYLNQPGFSLFFLEDYAALFQYKSDP